MPKGEHNSVPGTRIAFAEYQTQHKIYPDYRARQRAYKARIRELKRELREELRNANKKGKKDKNGYAEFQHNIPRYD